MRSDTLISGLMIIGACVVATPVLAQDFAEQSVRDVGVKTIEKAVQCEIGVFAASVRRLPQNYRQAAFSISDEFKSGSGFGGGLGGLGLKIGGDYNVSTTNGFAGNFRPRNIHADNRRACPTRRNRTSTLVLLGLRSCLSEAAASIETLTDFSCTTQMNVKSSLTGGISVTFIVTFDLHGSWNDEYSRTIKVIMPAGAGRRG